MLPPADGFLSLHLWEETVELQQQTDSEIKDGALLKHHQTLILTSIILSA